MRFMIMVRATADSEAGRMPEESLLAAMVNYHEALSKAGVLLDANGLLPSSRGWRVQYDAQGERKVLDGPFAETKELIAGYTMIQAARARKPCNGRYAFPHPSPASPARSRCGSCTSWRISRPAPPSNGSATFLATDNNRSPQAEVPERCALP